MAFFRAHKIYKKGNFKCSYELEKHILSGHLEGGQLHESGEEEEEGNESYEVGVKDRWDPCAGSKKEETNERRGKRNDEEGYAESHLSGSTANSIENEDKTENRTNVECESGAQGVDGDFLWSVMTALNEGKKSHAVRLRGGDEHAEQVIDKMPQIHLSKKYIDVGCLATWKLSSSKSKSDTKKLKDNNVNTYWQSSGLGPHTITVQFFKLTKISKIYLLLNYSLDESYTPYEISIKVGNDENRLDILCNTFCDVNKHPVDDAFWFIIDLGNFQLHSYFYNYNMNAFKRMNFIYCHCIQICVMSSHHYGRDTRIRQVKIFGPTYPFYEHDKSLIL
ncbi:hypothetical protein C922_00726 [Plasmodium inui San Antonio 1]|uniref:DOC domain-containing protein n=1 Tax=Plasmodium inui San Antonio 1 TaxID=1237626 RepID=W7AJN4_9APIC|nr:hypothetical protein C922_00726 [Plasmodium inui San Antonio 1]EUD69034.1 hypothetical protein C922_00726 [Plasmodium inui San Antonio 1]